MNELKVFVATHKAYDFPKNVYTPIHVGYELTGEDFGYMKDNHSTDNISIKNASFCELTALYLIWKSEDFNNLSYIGLSHYRRYFEGKKLLFKEKYILGEEEALVLLQEYDVIVPRRRNYYIESVASHYSNAHYRDDLKIVEQIVKEKSPDYIKSYYTIMDGKTLHLYNMFVTRKEIFDSYMEWLFAILFELEKRIDISMYDDYQKRVFGFISERLWNVWLLENKLTKKELKVVNIEGENLLKKVYGMLKRKYLNK